MLSFQENEGYCWHLATAIIKKMIGYKIQHMLYIEFWFRFNPERMQENFPLFFQTSQALRYPCQLYKAGALLIMRGWQISIGLMKDMIKNVRYNIPEKT